MIRQLLPNANIDVYEKSDSVGGRLSVVKVGNNDFEAGGSIIHNKNQYLVSFMKETGKNTSKFFLNFALNKILSKKSLESL